MKKLLPLLLFSISSLHLFAQEPLYNDTTNIIHISASVISSSGSDIPFWLKSNQLGIYAGDNGNFQTLSFLIHQNKQLGNSSFGVNYGTYLIAGNSGELYFQPNQLFGGLSFKGLMLKAGLFADREMYGGLSTSNGNIARSLNARPYPKIRFGTNGYIQAPFWKNWFRIFAEYDEGLLDDKRFFIEPPHLHHKSFYAKASLKELGWALTLGLEHYVMWGGTSPLPSIGKQPDSFKSYFYYITGTRTDIEGFSASDSANVPGNQYGTYQAKIDKDFENVSLSFYFSHPFEDLSGVNWRNWSDKLYGLEFKLKDRDAICTHILYEYTDTRHQGIKDTNMVWNSNKQAWERIDSDNYYTHGNYKSGVTYHNKAMSSPLFEPIKYIDGISRGPRNTRFWSHHVGAKGNVSKTVQWKSLVTFSHYIGNWGTPLVPPENQFSCLLQFSYLGNKLPFKTSFSLSGDAGDLYENRIAAALKLSKTF